MNLLPKLSSQSSQSNDNQRKARLRTELMRREAEIGGQLFGPVPKNHWRQFFCLDRRTWVWHEEWVDDSGQRQAVTTRYEVRSDGIIKAQDGRAYQRISRQEAINLYKSVQLYHDKIQPQYQQLLQAA